MSDHTDTPDPTIGELQDAVDDWITQWEEGYWPPLSNLARLTEEVGELARLLNRRFGAKKAKSGESDDSDTEAAALEAREEMADELGDILFVVITLANDLDIDLGQALARVLEKYDVRDADRWTRRS